MAENSNAVEQKLPDIFNEIWKKYDFLEKTEESTSSDKVQGYVYNACESCKAAIDMVNTLAIFSTNEDIEEVATNEIKHGKLMPNRSYRQTVQTLIRQLLQELSDLGPGLLCLQKVLKVVCMRYMLLPALMGYFTMKNTVRDRLKVVKESQDYFKDFMKMCKNYGVTNAEVAESPDKELAGEARAGPPQRVGAADIRYMAGSRNSKIQRYKEQKEMEKKLNDLRDQVEKDSVDDEVKRDYHLTVLKRWVNICIDEMDSIQSEIGILEMMAARRDQGEKPVKKKEAENKTPPLRPFIITKDMVQKQVFGLGYPGIPSMTIEEFCDQKIEMGHIQEGAIGHSMQDWAMDPDRDKEEREKEEEEKENKLDKEDPTELQRVREWDEYRDDHRRGWGNRQNMG